ncbi:hypothetical protein GDO86_013694, partial [Hymenochirus boettgeri]
SGGEVCYSRIGCFKDDAPWGGTLQRPIKQLPLSPEEVNTRFLLFTRENPTDFQEVSAINTSTISSSSFRTHRKTRFIIHGFFGEQGWIIKMCQTMLQVEDVNCFMVDWSGGAQTLYTKASNNLRVVGAEVAYFIDILSSNFGYSPSNVHIIGHSLGAHAAGEVGKRRSGISRITGLDPAKLYFQKTPIEVRLDPSDADFVDVIHTDAAPVLAISGLGMNQLAGHVDFFPNGGEGMPGCEKRILSKIVDIDSTVQVTRAAESCNHLRSHKYYTESILTSDGFVGFPSTSYSSFSSGSGFPCPSGGCPLMGHYAGTYSGITSNSQMFYLNTGDLEKDFSRWRYKVTVKITSSGDVDGYFHVTLYGENGSSGQYMIYDGEMSSGSSYGNFIDVERDVGALGKVDFVWNNNIREAPWSTVGAESITVQYGKDGKIYRFCGNGNTEEETLQTLTTC